MSQFSENTSVLLAMSLTLICYINVFNEKINDVLNMI